MPFDGKNFETAPPAILPGLASWLETQNPTTTYQFRDVTGNCLLGHYAKATGEDWRALHRQATGTAWYGRVCTGVWGPETYGEALKRARNMLGVKPPRKWWQFWRS
jgi:hypothetical protein